MKDAQDEPNLLRSLRRDYESTHHADYVRYVMAALNHSDSTAPRNIAVSAAYGLGKSSILQQVETDLQKRVINISFSTFNARRFASTRSSGPETSDGEVLESVQKEIVKQILYRESPTKVRASRFRRLDIFHVWSSTAVSALISAVLVAVIYQVGLASRLESLAAANAITIFLGYVIAFILFTIILTVAQWFLQGLRVSRVATTNAEIELRDGEGNYLDKYLDEIVYFFARTKHDVVIFEDLDRFNNPDIFEQLRELNTLLNQSALVAVKPIRFVYAIRDSLFEKWNTSDSHDSGPIRAHQAAIFRAKFFDLVIPVVPFITHRTANEVLAKGKSADRTVSDSLMQIVARHIPDMRLITNIWNEFEVFARVLRLDQSELKLSPDQLFGMVVYKNLRMGDFESLQFGTSRLDEIYVVNRSIVNAHSARIDAEIAELSTAAMESTILESLAVRAGGCLSAFAHQVASYSTTTSVDMTYRISGTQTFFDEESTQSVAFWEQVNVHPGKDIVAVDSSSGANFRLPFEEVFTQPSMPFTSSDWSEAGTRKSNELMTELRADRDMLRRASYSELIQRHDLKVTVRSELYPAPSVGTEQPEESFSDAAKRLFPDGPEFEMIAHDFISAHFNLYAATFYGRNLSAAATTFQIQTVDRRTTDFYYEFESEQDVTRLLAALGPSIFFEPSILNIAIFNLLIDSPDLDPAILQLAEATELGKAFTQAYLLGGTRPLSLLRRLAAVWADVFTFAIDANFAAPVTRLSLVDEVIRGSVGDVSYSSSPPLVDFLRTHISDLAALRGAEGQENAARLAAVLDLLGVIVPALDELPPSLVSEIGRRGRFDMTVTNLQNVSGGPEIALDVIRSDPAIFEVVTARLNEYLDVVASNEGQRSIKKGSEFVMVLGLLGSLGVTDVERVARLASPKCRLVDLKNVPPAQWGSLLDSERVDPTALIVGDYVSSWGFDAVLLRFLNKTGALDSPDELTETQKRSLIVALVNDSGLHLPKQLQLSVSLRPTAPLAASTLTIPEGPMAGLFVRSRLLADDLATFQRIRTMTIETFVHYLVDAKEFPNYAVLAGLTSVELEVIFDSFDLSGIQRFVWSNNAAFLAVLTDRNWQQIALFLVSENETASDQVLLQLVVSGSAPELVAELLMDPRTVRSDSYFLDILRRLGGDFQRLAQHGRGTVKLRNTTANRALAARVAELGFANVPAVLDEDATIRLNLKHGK